MSPALANNPHPAQPQMQTAAPLLLKLYLQQYTRPATAVRDPWRQAAQLPEWLRVLTSRNIFIDK